MLLGCPLLVPIPWEGWGFSCIFQQALFFSAMISSWGLPYSLHERIHSLQAFGSCPQAGGWENFSSKTPAQKLPVIQFGAGGEGAKLIFIISC